MTPDPAGTSFLAVALGADAVAPATAWAGLAESIGPTQVLELSGFDDGESQLCAALDRARIGIRMLLVGGQYDVGRARAAALTAGACADEIATQVLHTADAAVFCVHCRAVQRMHPKSGVAHCPGCGRTVEVYDNYSGDRGSFLAAAAEVRG